MQPVSLPASAGWLFYATILRHPPAVMNSDLATLPYTREPRQYCGTIPVFLERDAYVENYDQIATDHLASEAEGVGNPFMDDRFWQEMERSTVALIAKHTRPKAKILDVGVGLGRLMSKFPLLDRYGTDISLPYLAEAYKKGIEVCAAFAEDLPYPDAFFDAVVSTDVLEHVLDLNAVVKELLRVLKPGGVAIIRVPYREDLKAYASPEAKYEFVHLRSFDEHGMRLFFEKIMRVPLIEVTYACPIPSATAFKGPSLLLGRVLARVMLEVTRRSFALGRALTRGMFGPSVINVVARKPA